MIAGRRAKVTDFGMSKLAGAAPSMTPLTMCPGTLAYMPPEALREPPRYTKKLDCFSEGVIMIQVCTRLWPEPGPRTQIVQDSRYPMGVVEAPVSEMERRKDHIDLIDPNHALLPIVNICLQFQDRDRPSSEELCQRLSGLKESGEYRDNVQQQQDVLLAKDNQIMIQIQQLQEKDRLLERKTVEITSLNRQHQEEVSSRERQFQEEISSRERQLRQLNQQLEEQEQVTAEFQQTNHSLQRQVEQLQQQLSQQSLKPSRPPPPSQAQIRGRQLQERESRKQLPVQPSLQVDHKPHPHRVRKMTLNWRDGGKAPFKMFRGAAVVDGDMAYFLDIHGDICSYDSSSKKWRKLPECPHKFCSLAIVNGQLTVIGGYVPSWEVTNKLLSLQTEWKDIFPSMPTIRSSAAAVTIKEHLIVAGGYGVGVGNLTTVEMMDTKTLVWSTVTSLPHPYSETSVTICGDQLYMLGGRDDNGKTKSVLTCSLRELLQSSSSSSISSLWHRVADAPAYRSTCAAVNGEPLAVGGRDEDRKPSAAIHKYNPTTDSWYLISNMPTARRRILVAVLPTNEMMVVGGYGEYHNLDIVEIASINFVHNS
jgi:hypothetical protein